MDNMLLIISGFMLGFYYAFCWYQLIFRKDKPKLIMFLLVVFVNAIALLLSNYLIPKSLNLIVLSILLIAINYFTLSKNIRISLVSVIISQAILSFSETSFVFCGSLIFGNEIDQIIYQPVPFLLLHFYVFFVSSLISKTKMIYYLYLLFCGNGKSNRNIEAIIYSIIIIIIMVVATIESHVDMPFTLLLLINSMMALVFISIVVSSSKTKESYANISNKYATSISSLREYEIMIDKFRVSSHENKNELLTIRNMVKDQKVINYIDALIDNKIKDNEKIMHQASKIPEGGLRATIYSKLCTMEKYKIKYELNISREVRTADLINIDDELTLKICKILGVFLDNAIEAVKHLKKKQIAIEMYVDDNYLCIDITNNFKGNLDLEKISSVKYSTKGNGRGYGLALVNQILKDEHEKLENEKSINRDMFTQILKIKM